MSFADRMHDVKWANGSVSYMLDQIQHFITTSPAGVPVAMAIAIGVALIGVKILNDYVF